MLHVVWFKRDLRVHDHAPLAAAAARGPVLPLYIVEDEAWQQPDAAARHWAFLRESLVSLSKALSGLGQPLVLRRGEAVAVLEALHRDHGPLVLYSHEETGADWSFRRDRRVAAWCSDRGNEWHEFPQTGVIRGLRQRRGWAARWEQRMRAPQVPAPSRLPALAIDPGVLPAAAELGLAGDHCPDRQPGGRQAGLALRDSFLAGRGFAYHRGMSSPLSAESACSRLSPHLAWGTLSIREVQQATREAELRLKSDPVAQADPKAREARRAMRAFSGRLHWHCHFMQKLESEPRLEFENLHPAYDGLREKDWNPDHFAAWCEGRTGLPFVDACMRYLRAGGWINFRMRAMLVAVSSYHLWLHWRQPALFLARQFVDYEPGIHFPQVQMQSGTTGINTVRIYNPVKQGFDHDPNGVFIRRWVPELEGLAGGAIHQPWLLGESERRCAAAASYPSPIIDPVAAARTARDRVWAVRRQVGYREQADDIQHRHGSRRPGLPPAARKRSRTVKAPDPQLSLDWSQ